MESTVSVTFDTRDDQTEVTLRHSGIPDDEIGRRTEWGWNHVLSSFGRRIRITPLGCGIIAV